MILTKYKDFIGIASADRDDTQKVRIKNLLNKRGVNIDEYDPVGVATDYYSGQYHYTILCRNPEDPENKRLLKVHLDPPITSQEFNYLIDNYSSIVVYNHDIDPNNIESLHEIFLK